MSRLIDMSGQKFGRWTVVERRGSTRRGEPLWQCRCECGVERLVLGKSLRYGQTLSCGCLHRERHTTHGMAHTPEYGIWKGMIQRCHNPRIKAYKQYGGRGVVVADEWRESFDAFLRDVGCRPSTAHSLDRIDPNGSYSPNNCRWVTRDVQANNTTRTVRVDVDGEVKTLAEWSGVSGVPAKAIYHRLRRGKSPREAVFGKHRKLRLSDPLALSRGAIHGIWVGMKSRCTNPKDKDYPRYGGAGITVCQRWADSFELFVADIGPRPTPNHTLHRINNDEGYSPGNCRWATRQEQQGNRRKSRMLTHDGRTQCMTAWAREIGVPYFLIQNRLNVLGWTVEDALTVPRGGKRRKSTTTTRSTGTTHTNSSGRRT